MVTPPLLELVMIGICSPRADRGGGVCAAGIPIPNTPATEEGERADDGTRLERGM